MPPPQIDYFGLPDIQTFCGQNAVQIFLNDVTLWFSYRELVAFRRSKAYETYPRIVRENDCDRTRRSPRGLHLNSIDGGAKEARVSAEEFQLLWNEFCARDSD